MLDTAPLASPATAVTTTDHLDTLIARTAAGDRAAFRCLYAFLVMSVWGAAARGLNDPAEAAAVARSTFVEVWHLARHHHNDDPHTDPRAWLMAITAGRVQDRTRILTGPGVDDYDADVHRELRDLLGPGRALIRTGPRTFTDIDDLDHAMTAIAAITRRRRAG